MPADLTAASPAPSAPLSDRVRAAVTDGHPLPALEAALVRLFLERQQLTVTRNPLLAGLAGRRDPASVAAHDALAAADAVGLDELVKAFELLVPEQDAKAYGAVFTPQAITSFMAREAVTASAGTGVPVAAMTVLDPAVGCGALLVAALREIADRTGRTPSAIVAEQLFGIDISPQSIHRAEVLLALTCLALGDDTADLTVNLAVADALMDDITAMFAGRAGFDVVLGNPPYVRFQNLTGEQRTDLAARWSTLGKGNFNLYFAFFELARAAAKPGGVIAYITPNTFFTALSAGPLRAWMTDHGYLDAILDFGHTRVFDALTYTAITFGRRREPGADDGTMRYAAVAGLPELAQLRDDWRTDAGVAYDHDQLGQRPWHLVGRADRAAIDAITAAGRPLADVADVRFGIATCRDKLYLLDGTPGADGMLTKVHDGIVYRIEPDATRRCIKVSDAADQRSLAAAVQRIIFPYDLIDSRAVAWTEAELADRYPGTYAYLTAIRAELEARDKGKKTYAQWFAYARTQGLVPSGAKLLTPLYAHRPRFLLDTDPDALFLNGCSVTPRTDGADLETLGWVLNSGVCHYFVERTAISIDGGYYAYQKSQLARLGVPTLTDGQRVQLRAAATPGDVDDLLAGIYGIQLPAEYRRS